MQIELPPDIADRVKRRAALDRLASEVEVIRKALDSLDWQDQERQAIQHGIDAWRAGDTKDFDQFDADFRPPNAIKSG
jgi:Arc/MetJ-type ribon-helix-helix transcriptional regulator